MYGHTRLHESRETKIVTLEDEHIVMMSACILHGWVDTNVEVEKDLQPYWSFRDEITIIDDITMKIKIIIIIIIIILLIIIIIIPVTLQDKTPEQLHLIHMGIEKTRLPASESIYWINMNSDIEEMVKYCSTCLGFQAI